MMKFQPVLGSGFLNTLQRKPATPTEDIPRIYGHPAYPLRPHLI